MLATSMRPSGHEYRFTPSHVETVAGSLNRPPKSPAWVTVAPRCFRTGRATEGRRQRVRRDDFHQELIPMYTPENKTPRPGARGAAASCEENHGANNTSPASKLIAEADAIAASIPFMMTRERKHAAGCNVLELWLRALTAGRREQAV